VIYQFKKDLGFFIQEKETNHSSSLYLFISLGKIASLKRKELHGDP